MERTSCGWLTCPPPSLALETVGPGGLCLPCHSWHATQDTRVYNDTYDVAGMMRLTLSDGTGDGPRDYTARAKELVAQFARAGVEVELNAVDIGLPRMEARPDSASLFPSTSAQLELIKPSYLCFCP